MSPNPLRNLPSVNDLLESPPLGRLVGRLSRSVVVSAARALLDETRHEIQNAASEMTLPSVADLAERVARRVLESEAPRLRPVINATGSLLESGLGRAPLAEEAIEEIAAVGRGYASLDMDLASGRPTARTEAAEVLLRDLGGAEAALVVNNQSGAVILALAALAAGRDVLVARGEVISTGDGYRLPEAVAAAGAVLREVGTANQTVADDYLAAIHERSGALLVVRPIGDGLGERGASAELSQLAAVGRRHGLPLILSLGGAALLDPSPMGLEGVPTVRDGLRRGADLVLLSGDKLLGGPQCGIVLGNKTLVERLRRHALARALRVGGLPLAALVATLRLYRDPGHARYAVPLLSLLATSEANLRSRAERLAPQMAAAEAIQTAEAVADSRPWAGGSAQPLATWCVSLAPAGASVDQLAARLRTGTPAVLGRISGERLFLDLRTVLPRQDTELVAAVAALAGG